MDFLFEMIGIGAVVIIGMLFWLWASLYIIGRFDKPRDPNKCYIQIVRGTVWCKTHQRLADFCKDK